MLYHIAARVCAHHLHANNQHANNMIAHLDAPPPCKCTPTTNHTCSQASHKDQCTTWQQQTQALQQQLAAAHTATAQHEAHAASLTKELQKCTEELQTQAGTHASALQNHSQQQQAVQDALDAAEREIAVQKQHAHESQVQVEALTVQVEALTAELADRAQRAQQADAQAASLRALVHALQVRWVV